MKNWKALLGLLLIFLLGAISGGLVVGAMAKRDLDRAIEGGPPVIRELIIRRLARELDLDAAQRARVEAIVSDAQQQIQSARMTIQPRVRIILRKAQSDIRSVLTPSQAEKYDRIALRGRARLLQADPALEPSPSAP